MMCFDDMRCVSVIRAPRFTYASNILPCKAWRERGGGVGGGRMGAEGEGEREREREREREGGREREREREREERGRKREREKRESREFIKQLHCGVQGVACA
jgi:hypothetical protein